MKGFKVRLTQLLCKVSLLVSTLLIMAILAEAGLRLAGAKPRTATVLSGFFQPDASRGWVGRPGVSMRFFTSDFDVVVNHDQAGFRISDADSAVETGKRPDAHTIWCVGDSTTWGFGVADDKSYVALLNRMSGPAVRFRNLGVPGYSSVQEYLLLKDLLEQGEKPDEILVLYATNDPQDNLDARGGSRPSIEIVDGKAVLHNETISTRSSWKLRIWLKQNSLAYNYFSYYLARAKEGLRNRKKAPGPAPAGEQQAELQIAAVASPADEQLGMLTAYRLIKELCDQHNVPLTIGMPVYTEMVVQVCRELQLPLADVSATLSQSEIAPELRQPVHFVNDGHWNELGNELVAQGLRDSLASQRLARKVSQNTWR